MLILFSSQGSLWVPQLGSGSSCGGQCYDNQCATKQHKHIRYENNYHSKHSLIERMLTKAFDEVEWNWLMSREKMRSARYKLCLLAVTCTVLKAQQFSAPREENVHSNIFASAMRAAHYEVRYILSIPRLLRRAFHTTVRENLHPWAKKNKRHWFAFDLIKLVSVITKEVAHTSLR